MPISTTVNGKKVSLDVDPDTPLLWVLRDDLNLTGTKFGCGAALCGACTIHIDGEAVRSCQIQARDVDGRDVTTIEGVNDNIAQAVQAAWIKLDVVQCGYCQPGQIMSAIGLLAQISKPTDDDIDKAMDGNVCRCATYQRIRAASGGVDLAAVGLRENLFSSTSWESQICVGNYCRQHYFQFSQRHSRAQLVFFSSSRPWIVVSSELRSQQLQVPSSLRPLPRFCAIRVA